MSISQKQACILLIICKNEFKPKLTIIFRPFEETASRITNAQSAAHLISETDNITKDEITSPKVDERNSGSVLVEVSGLLRQVVALVTGSPQWDTVSLVRHCTHEISPDKQTTCLQQLSNDF